MSRFRNRLLVHQLVPITTAVSLDQNLYDYNYYGKNTIVMTSKSKSELIIIYLNLTKNTNEYLK